MEQRQIAALGIGVTIALASSAATSRQIIPAIAIAGTGATITAIAASTKKD